MACEGRELWSVLTMDGYVNQEMWSLALKPLRCDSRCLRCQKGAFEIAERSRGRFASGTRDGRPGVRQVTEARHPS